jgi:small subunit ribosomal protein S20
MAHTLQARKRVRQTKTRTARSRARISEMRTYVRSLEEALSGADPAKAEAAFRRAQAELMRGAQHGVIRKQTVARKVARLHKRLKALSAKAS